MPVSALGAQPAVMDAIQRASARSGVGFDYLLATARRESGLDCQAKSKTSSACGLYQFVAQTWLSALKAHGAEHGLGAYAADIERNAQGQLTVADPARRAEILALRQDPTASAALAAELTADNAGILADKLGRPPTDGELYAAHVLGAAGAAKLLTLAEANPDQSAAAVFPDAASRNRGLFYDRSGAPLSVSALAGRLTAGPAAAQTAALRPSIGLSDEAPAIAVPGVETASAESAMPAAAAPQLAGDAEPSAWAFWRGGMTHAPLTLTPQLLSILATLDPPEGASSDARTDGQRPRI